MRRVRFIHTADLHLGSNLSVGRAYPSELSSIFDNAIYNAFIHLCEEAINNKVDFIVIVGDIYDRESRSVKANIFFNKQCEHLARNNIPVYIVAGNHDPLSVYNQLIPPPDNVYIFSGDQAEIKEVVDKKGNIIAAISGCSYNNRAESRKLHLDYENLPGVWNIGLLHTQLEAENNNYVPSSLRELLEKKNINYWALGHLHQYNLLYQEKNNAIIYPGIPQGRVMGEEGRGGAVLVDLIPDSRPKIKFIDLSSIIYQRIEIPVDSIKNGNLIDLQKLILEIGEELLKNNFYIKSDNPLITKGYVVDWVLTGRSEISRLLKEEKEEALDYLYDSLQEALTRKRPFIWTRKIIDRTGTLIDEKLLLNNPVYNDIEKISFLLKENETFQEELIEDLGLIWSANSDHEEKDHTKFYLNNTTLQTILRQARQAILEELLSRRELS